MVTPLLEYDAWLSGVVRRAAYRVNVPHLAAHVEDRDAPASGHVLAEAVARAGFCYAKIPARDVHLTRCLEQAGFRLIDTNLTFEKRSLPPDAADARIRPARPEDRATLRDLARSNFTLSRFHLDDAFPRDLADTLKAQWVDGFFDGRRGDALLVATVDAQPAGFVLLLDDADGGATIDLIAVDAAYRRQGIGRALIAGAEARLPAASPLRVGTQVANLASVGLYEQAGFRLCNAQYVFHFHHSTGSSE